jgi:hypothetical protein
MSTVWCHTFGFRKKNEMNFKRRVGRLEKEFNVVMEVSRLRIVSREIIGLHEPTDGNDVPIGTADAPLGLVNCERYFHNGRIYESVEIVGSEIPDDEIDRYVESFPIRGVPPNQKFRIADGK